MLIISFSNDEKSLSVGRLCLTSMTLPAWRFRPLHFPVCFPPVGKPQCTKLRLLFANTFTQQWGWATVTDWFQIGSGYCTRALTRLLASPLLVPSSRPPPPFFCVYHSHVTHSAREKKASFHTATFQPTDLIPELRSREPRSRSTNIPAFDLVRCLGSVCKMCGIAGIPPYGSALFSQCS